MSEVDPFGKLLDVIDQRMVKFGPDRTGVMGLYFLDDDGVKKVRLDNDQVIPNPVITLGVALGGRYPCVWMQDGHDIALLAGPLTVQIWGCQEFAFGDSWFKADGSEDSGVIIMPPDDDAYDAGNLPPPDGAAWYAGASDGTFHYHLAVDAGGQWYVDKFNDLMTELLERWEIPDWFTAIFPDPSPYHEAFFDIQHVSANDSRIVVLAHHVSLTDPYSIDVTVFDRAGTVLAQWVAKTGTTLDLGQLTGSCTDGSFVYFQYNDDDANTWWAKVNLLTGEWTDLFTIDTVDDQVPEAVFGTSLGAGLVVKDGDLIIAGGYGLARVRQDGTVVWWGDIPDTHYEYRGMAHSGRGSVWVSRDSNKADEWTYGGHFVQTIDIVEPLIQAWAL